MSKREMAFAAYILTMADQQTTHIRFTKKEQTDLRNCLEKSVNVVDDDGKKWRKISTVLPDMNDNWLCGWLHAGETLEEKPILEKNGNGKSFRQTGKVLKNQSAMNSHFFAIYSPPNLTHSFVLLQQRGNSCNLTFLHQLLISYYNPKNRRVKLGRVGPVNMKEIIKTANLQRITFIKRRFQKVKLNGLENFGDLTAIGKMTLSFEPHSNGDLNVFKGLIDRVSKSKKEGFSLSNELDFDPDQIKFAVEVNGRQMTIETDARAVGRPAWVGEIVHDKNDDPELSSLLQYAAEVYEAVMKL